MSKKHLKVETYPCDVCGKHAVIEVTNASPIYKSGSYCAKHGPPLGPLSCEVDIDTPMTIRMFHELMVPQKPQAQEFVVVGINPTTFLRVR